MKTTTRRIMLALGAALLVGGCGLIFGGPVHVERHPGKNVTVRAYSIPGTVTMAVGAGLIGFAVIKTKNEGRMTC